MFDSLIFDLDGTLWDACAATARGWSDALSGLGISRTVSADDIASVAGKPFDECVRALLPEVGEVEFREVVEAMDQGERKAVGESGGVLYSGVSTGLRRLAGKYRLFLVSNCQQWYLEAFLKQSGLKSVFEDVECHGRTGRSKAGNIRFVVERNRLGAPVYIGDTAGDQVAAKEAGVEFFHVSYGFGACGMSKGFASFEELEGALLNS